MARQARLRGGAAGEFALVFVAIGVPYDTAEHFRAEMENSGVLEHTVLFLNLASDSSTQRLLAPRYALTAAEYLAFDEGRTMLERQAPLPGNRRVLVVLTDGLPNRVPFPPGGRTPLTYHLHPGTADFLAGPEMTDVIFNGSSSRKPVGTAVIELVFDNGDGSAGGQYAQYSQISVKRQV